MGKDWQRGDPSLCFRGEEKKRTFVKNLLLCVKQCLDASFH